MNKSDIEIERAVLGEILTFESCRLKAALISSDDFSFEEHSDIAGVILSLEKEGKPYDFITVANLCGTEYRPIIQQCIQTAVTAAMFDEHLRLLKAMASQRRLIARFHALSLDGDVSVNTVQQMVENEKQRSLNTDVKKASCERAEQFLEKLNEKKGSLLTGFSTIDSILGGIREGTVFIVGARPSVGKTAFALNIATNQLKNKSVMFFSLEMSAEMIYERVMASILQIDYEKFSRNTLSDNDISAVKEETQKILDSGNLTVIDDVYNIEHICNLICEQKPALAVVDFMQIISASGKFENVRNRIDYISAMFKRAAKATGCVILVLSQLSRIGGSSPTMSDLKESGGLEQDGDYIALLHRPYVASKREGEYSPEETELMLDKNKFGRTGIINLWFDLKHQKFHELDTWHESKTDRSGTAFEDDVEI